MKNRPEEVGLPPLPPISETVPDVFILESLKEEDEQLVRYEGRSLSEMLRLAGKRPHYHYFQHERELPDLIRLFRLSQCRFLHVSCHGGGAAGTDVIFRSGPISYLRFAQLFSGHLKLRRIFFSACELGNELFAVPLAGRNKGMHSIVAPAAPVDFHQAAALWTAFYISMFAEDDSAMTHDAVEKRLAALRTLFPTDMHLSTYHPSLDKWRHRVVR